MTLRNIERLDECYQAGTRTVFLTGLQALVRLLLLQRWSDERAGLNTGGFVSGYRGSPLGGLDRELWRASTALKKAGIHFEPGVNEELAANRYLGLATVQPVSGDARRWRLQSLVRQRPGNRPCVGCAEAR